MSLQLISCCMFVATTLAVSAVKIQTPLGAIEGTDGSTTRLGKKVFSFRGIRYAEPPINEMRFKRPVPTGAWTGTYNATADGAACPQTAIPNVPISEDCLFLNIYTTKLPPSGALLDVHMLRPVIVYIHGGDFVRGSSHSSVISPKYVLDKDVLFVSFNYRLGVFGFLAVSDEVPGNNGLVDQVAALQWVVDNIRAFGGDPNSVTLYGFDAGSASVSLHLTSRMSRGLFQKAVLASGSMYGAYPIPIKQRSLAQKQARLVGCPDDAPEAIVDCLRTKTHEEITQNSSAFYTFGTNPIMSFSPVIEQDFEQEKLLNVKSSILDGTYDTLVGRDNVFVAQVDALLEEYGLLKPLNDDLNSLVFQTADRFDLNPGFNQWPFRTPDFLNEHPIKSIVEGNFARVPVMAGISRDEVAQQAREIIADPDLLRKLNDDFYTWGPEIFQYEKNSTTSREISDAIRQFYFHNESITEAKSQELGRVFADSIVGFGMNRAVDIISENNRRPVYYYEFTYDEKNEAFGVKHGIEQQYLFPNDLDATLSATEVKIVELMTSHLSNFASTGNPNLVQNTNWAEYDEATKKYLDIGEKPTLKDHLFDDRYAFWKDLFPVSSHSLVTVTLP